MPAFRAHSNSLSVSIWLPMQFNIKKAYICMYLKLIVIHGLFQLGIWSNQTTHCNPLSSSFQYLTKADNKSIPNPLLEVILYMPLLFHINFHIASNIACQKRWTKHQKQHLHWIKSVPHKNNYRHHLYRVECSIKKF